MALKKFKQLGDTNISRKESRKNAKKLKKIQAKAFAAKKPIEKVMRESMGMTKEDKKKRKKQRQKENKREERKMERMQQHNDNEGEGESDDEDASDMEDDDDNNHHTATKRPRVVEISVHKGKRKYGDQSEDEDDSDEDLTYEQYMKEVEVAKKKRRQGADGIEDDDAAIRKYGVLLGLSEKKKDKDGITKVPKSFNSDGLDMLLDFCDAEKRKTLMEKETGDEENEEEDDDFDMMLKKTESDDEEEMDFSEGESDELAEDIDDEDIDEELEDEEVEYSDEEVGEDESDEEITETEDIYGRKINKQTGELIKYDPAAAKKKLEELDKLTESSSSAEQKAKVDRAITGIINRLSDATLVKSQQSVAELWSSSSKNDVKNALCKVLTRVLDSSFRVQDSLLTTYGAFIAMCHSMISNEISAHFVEVFLCEMVKLSKEEDEDAFADNKSIENRVVFVAMLVSFRVITPSVLLELVDKYAENLTLNSLQCINLLISYSYKSLKKTSWPQVTDKIEVIATQFSKKPISSLPRAKFLLEQVDALKKQSPKMIDYTVIEHQVKVLQGLSKKSKNAAENKELGMTLDDLLHAEVRGRWWVVGSAYRLPEQGGYGLLATGLNKKGGNASYPEEIVTLAGKAGMNSEVRRNIFCCVATADDEDEAFEKLVRLGLKGEKERELVHVLVVMMTKEKSFNPFYAALLQRFCEYNKRFVITLQYALWDRLRECDALKLHQRTSLAQLLAHLISKEVVPITILKSVEWATRWPSLTTIIKKLFLSLSKLPESVLRRVFEPLTNPEKRKKFEMLSEGMRVFWHMHHKDCEVYKNVDRWIMEGGYD